jgi:hypothetical protein
VAPRCHAPLRLAEGATAVQNPSATVTSDDEGAPTAPTGDGETVYGHAAPFRRAQGPAAHPHDPRISQDIPTYRPASAARDLLAELTVAALAVPSAMAYGQLAGLSPVNGLYALLLPTVA